MQFDLSAFGCVIYSTELPIALYEHSNVYIFKLPGKRVTSKNVEQVPHPCLKNVELLPVITGKKDVELLPVHYLLVIVPVSTCNQGGLKITRYYW